jgi:hypothetical protein
MKTTNDQGRSIVNSKELKSMLSKGGASRREALKTLGAAGLGLPR